MCFVVGWGRTNFQFLCQKIFRNKQQSNYLKITEAFISDELCITGSNYSKCSQCQYEGKKMIRTRPSRTQKVNKIHFHYTPCFKFRLNPH